MKLVIIGGGGGGATAAARVRRLDEKVEIVLIDRGEELAFAHCGLPYYIGGIIKERKKLFVSSIVELRDRYNIDVRAHHDVTVLNTETKEIRLKHLSSGETSTESYDKLLVATGAEPILPFVLPKDDSGIFRLRNIADADLIYNFVDSTKPKKAVIVGGGFIGLELLENLAQRGLQLSLVEMAGQVMGAMDREMVEPIHQAIESRNIELFLSCKVERVEKTGEQLILTLSDSRTINCDILILATGVRPNVELAKLAGLAIGASGGIKVNEFMRTSNPDVYAVGDAVETANFITGEATVVPLAGPGNRQARIAADNICGRPSRYKGTFGTAIVRIFNISAAATGAGEKTLRRLNIPYQKCYLHPFSHAQYYPGARFVSVKVLYSPGEGRIFGAQVIGEEAVDKLVNVLSTAIYAKMSVEDLCDLQLAYSPQFGSAKDPANLVGFVPVNIINGDAPTIHWDELDTIKTDEKLLLDVRDNNEVKSGGVPGAKHIPLNDLRRRIGELPKEVTIYPYCLIGARSYTATRFLNQIGYNAKNISGGFKSYMLFRASK